MEQISEKSIERLILYRRLLLGLQARGVIHIYSHELAAMAGVTAAQLRKDLTPTGYYGSPVYGYEINQLMSSISEIIDAPEMQNVALVGLGQLGRAVLDYFQGRRPKLQIMAAFDTDPSKINRVIHGCRCYHIDELEKVIKQNNIIVGILAVPPDEAQEIAERMVMAGIKGLLNYAPVQLKLPEDVYVENRDMIMAVEKVAFFARQSLKGKEVGIHESIS
ncbi:MAG: redox-sensing transcriptional repressor Rex [candidate division KSB1 bacterium]|nr:redox-sensing transcriptional repressor Rex [candidate division KSB1 bacterium]